MAGSNDFNSNDMVRYKDKSHITTPDKIVVDGVTIAISSHPQQQIKLLDNNLLAVYPNGTYINCEGEIIYLGESVVTCSDFESFKLAIDKMIDEFTTLLDTLVTNHRNNMIVAKNKKENQYWISKGKPNKVVPEDDGFDSSKYLSSGEVMESINPDYWKRDKLDEILHSFAVYPIRRSG